MPGGLLPGLLPAYCRPTGGPMRTACLVAARISASIPHTALSLPEREIILRL